MPNMSYCRFENTYNDLLDCFQVLEEDGFDRVESMRELEYSEDIARLAARYIEVYNATKAAERAAVLGITPDE